MSKKRQVASGKWQVRSGVIPTSHFALPTLLCPALSPTLPILADLAHTRHIRYKQTGRNGQDGQARAGEGSPADRYRIARPAGFFTETRVTSQWGFGCVCCSFCVTTLRGFRATQTWEASREQEETKEENARRGQRKTTRGVCSREGPKDLSGADRTEPRGQATQSGRASAADRKRLHARTAGSGEEREAARLRGRSAEAIRGMARQGCCGKPGQEFREASIARASREGTPRLGCGEEVFPGPQGAYSGTSADRTAEETGRCSGRSVVTNEQKSRASGGGSGHSGRGPSDQRNRRSRGVAVALPRILAEREDQHPSDGAAHQAFRGIGLRVHPIGRGGMPHASVAASDCQRADRHGTCAKVPEQRRCNGQPSLRGSQAAAYAGPKADWRRQSLASHGVVRRPSHDPAIGHEPAGNRTSLRPKAGEAPQRSRAACLASRTKSQKGMGRGRRSGSRSPCGYSATASTSCWAARSCILHLAVWKRSSTR